jgi:NhaP-type Na+/H+ or K+/H+ antiporter
MSLELVAAFAVAAAAYAVLGHLIGRVLPPPPFFALVGAGIWVAFEEHLPHTETMMSESTIALTLAIVLFTDASVVNLAGGRRAWGLHGRLLLVAMPITIAITVLLGLPLAGIGLAAALLVAGVVAPTDAALVDPIIANEDVPQELRTSLVVEAGLNDGLATPVIALAAATVGVTSALEAPNGVGDSLISLVIGALVGGVIGGGFGWFLARAEARGWASRPWEPVSLFGVAGFSYLIAEHLGGVALVAVFVAGGAWHAAAPRIAKRTREFTEDVSHLLAALAFTWFGMVAVDYLPGRLTAASVLFALGVLVLARPVATWIATIGTHLRPGERLLLGWYGPRGLASVLFLALLSEGEDLPDAVVLPCMATIVLSLVLHGLTAGAARRFVPDR